MIIKEKKTQTKCCVKLRKPRRSRRTRKDEYDQDEVDGPVIDESVLSAKELLGLQQAEERLKRDCIYRLKKVPLYPSAKYTCKLCDVLIESVAFAHKHIKEKRHKKSLKEKQEEELLTALPPPTPSQIQAIGVAIENVVQEFGLNNEDLEERLNIKASKCSIILFVAECSLRLYGSSYSRFGFKTSDINIDIQFPANVSRIILLCLSVDADFHARIPVVVCREKQSGLICKVSAGNENACLTTKHLATLGKLEPTLVPLVIAFRYWAKLCCVDRPEEGGLSPYVFALMVIFFLQQRKEPFLPVYLGSWVPLVFESGQQCSAHAGQLWVELLRFYALEFNMADLVISIRLKEAVSRESKDWPKKRIAVEDPYSVKRNVARTLNSQLVYEYILHCLRATYKYFALPHKRSAKLSKKTSPNATEEKSEMLDHGKDAIKHENSELQNLDGRTNTAVMEDCRMETIGMPQTHRIDPSKLLCRVILRARDELDNTGSGDDDALSEEEEHFSIPIENEHFEENVGGHLRINLSQEDLTEKGSLFEENTAIEQCSESELFYEFSKPAFTKGKSPTVVCSLCKREGHLKRDCPEDFKKIELDPLPALTPKFSVILDQVCVQCYHDFAPNVVEDQAREHIRQNLENFIRQDFPGTKLNLFGSSKNGFGFKQSDLDICMTMDGLETAEGLDCIRIIEDLAKVLKKESGLRNVLPITTAKVPIVKFFHVRSGLEVDISLYNTLALHNTRLLSAYAAIDPRVKYLCYTMKVFTKICDIGDASRGSLSSYAYTLMVLYFLQQRNPPVIPVLQEIYKEPKKPEILVDGWNVYFFDKIEELSVVWPDCGKNTESIGQLWLGLLRFYTEEFDFKEHVICIRRKNLLTTFKKQWTSKYIVIEDPFDLNHNLGAGLSRKMTNFIMKAFINGRRVFGTPIKIFPKEYPSKMVSCF
uniref:Terminal uridylyl transferase 7 n=1 Tax=Accipiter nisus TaxID=211598 RepID=A0A8B9S2C8_9AVES